MLEAVEVSRHYFFKKLVVETKMSLPQDFRTTFKQILACIFLSVRPKLLVTFQYEIPCTTQNQEFSLSNGPDHLDWGLHNPSRILAS